MACTAIGSIGTAVFERQASASHAVEPYSGYRSCRRSSKGRPHRLDRRPPLATVIGHSHGHRSSAASFASRVSIGGLVLPDRPRRALRVRRSNVRRLTPPSASAEIAATLAEPDIIPGVVERLGNDAIAFFACTVVVIPFFKSRGVSPVLGFLSAGVLLQGLHLVEDQKAVSAIGDLGILFLLFEMGLELSVSRIKTLGKYALGIGLPALALCTAAFTGFELPIEHGLGSRMLEQWLNAPSDLADIRSVDEALVIGAALSLSSSAFVLQTLQDKGDLGSRFGSATLGILLVQDIAIIPLLVVLPVIEAGGSDLEGSTVQILASFAFGAFKSIGGLGALIFGGRYILERAFTVVADARSKEAFVALVLLSITGTAQITSALGFSDTLGAFVAGTLLASTNYRLQIEADIAPFRGLLLGLFFVVTGSEVNLQILAAYWPEALALLGGLLAIKAAIIGGLSLRQGLTLPEAVRTGLILSQGGEFAFVVLSEACRLGVLPDQLNKLLIIVVVLSMALTPGLAALGDFIADKLPTPAIEEDVVDGLPSSAESVSEAPVGGHDDAVVICGFGPVGQVVASMLSNPVSGGKVSFIAIDSNTRRVEAGKAMGYPVIYGDASSPDVISSAGVVSPRAIVVAHQSVSQSLRTVASLRCAYPEAPILARCPDLSQVAALTMAGATTVLPDNAEMGLRSGEQVLNELGLWQVCRYRRYRARSPDGV